VLTIGFARRFATYKRGSLVLRDVDRLLRIVTDVRRPVQIIFAGKAHPMDEPGKLIIQQVYRQLKRAEFAGRIVFLEDYDINLARYLVQGVDVWMNNPRRPLEASGTSGMKAALNGVLNFSVLDGWWQEGYNGDNGWAIGDDSEQPNPDEQDARDAESLYSTLENQIVPLYYESGQNQLSPGWLRKMKTSIATLAPIFNTRRMVKQYVEEMYLPQEEPVA
jgi:glycogen phosphorylase